MSERYIYKIDWLGNDDEWIEDTEADDDLNLDDVAKLLNEQQTEIERLNKELLRLRCKCGPDEMAEGEYYTLAKLEEDNERLRAFAKRVYEDGFSLPWAVGAAANLLGMTILAHGCDEEVGDE